jgi:hypothetical protein
MRIFSLVLTINNGAAKRYTVAPIPLRERGPRYLTGFRLVQTTDDPHPVYHVRLDTAGAVSCTCPAFVNTGKPCKHAEALRAAGLLPDDLVQILIARDALVNAAEARAAGANRQAAAALAETERITSEASTEQQVHDHDLEALRQRIRELEGELADVGARAVQMQTALAAIQSAPRRRTRKVAA